MSDILSEPDSADADSQTIGLFLNLAVGIPITVVCLFLFEPLRRKIPSVFEARRQLNLAGEPVNYMGKRIYTPTPPSYRIFGWLMPTLRLDLETVADTHGLDAALFLRYHRFMLALFSFLSIPVLLLLPVYYTGPNKNLAPDSFAVTMGINKFSISNIDRNDNWRFWVILVAEYGITIFVCYHVFRQLSNYAGYRRRYRATQHPANYAIIVQDIPPKQCSEEAVHEYWNHIFPGEIAAVFFVQDARGLEKDKLRFWNAVDKRERAEHKQHRHHMKRRKKRQRLEQKGKPLKPPPPHSDQPPPTRSCCFAHCAPRNPHHAIHYWRDQQTRYYAKVVAHQILKEEGVHAPTQSAIVVFNSRRTASVAAQTNFSRTEDQWRVQRAPEPEAINWSALAVSGWTVYTRAAVTTLLSISFTLLWVFPVTAIMGLVSLSSLADININGSKPLAFLNDIANVSPLVTGFLESWLPTVLLTVFLSIVPNIFEFFVSISRIVSQSSRDLLVRDWYFVFVTFSNFLFVTFAGTLLKELSQILETPSKTVEILARNIPKQAAFMMNFILLTALTETPRELLQIYRVGERWFKLKFTSKTKRQRDEADVGDMEFDYVGFYAMGQLVTLLGLVYCTIQPLIILCCVGYFAISYVVFKYNICYALYNEYQDGGRMYGGAIYAIWVGLFVHLLTMIGVLGLNNSPEQSALIIIPTVVSVLFVLHCFKSFYRVSEHGSALETQDRMEEFDGGIGVDEIPSERAELYQHPGFEELPPLEELENLNGIPEKAKGGDEDPLNDKDSSFENRDRRTTGIPNAEQGLDAVVHFQDDGHEKGAPQTEVTQGGEHEFCTHTEIQIIERDIGGYIDGEADNDVDIVIRKSEEGNVRRDVAAERAGDADIVPEDYWFDVRSSLPSSCVRSRVHLPDAIAEERRRKV